MNESFWLLVSTSKEGVKSDSREWFYFRVNYRKKIFPTVYRFLFHLVGFVFVWRQILYYVLYFVFKFNWLHTLYLEKSFSHLMLGKKYTLSKWYSQLNITVREMKMHSRHLRTKSKCDWTTTHENISHRWDFRNIFYWIYL